MISEFEEGGKNGRHTSVGWEYCGEIFIDSGGCAECDSQPDVDNENVFVE